MTQAQVSRIGKFARRVIVMDSDFAGQQAALKLANELGVFPGRTLMVETDAKDPCESSERELAALRRLL